MLREFTGVCSPSASTPPDLRSSHRSVNAYIWRRGCVLSVKCVTEGGKRDVRWKISAHGPLTGDKLTADQLRATDATFCKCWTSTACSRNSTPTGFVAQMSVCRNIWPDFSAGTSNSAAHFTVHCLHAARQSWICYITHTDVLKPGGLFQSSHTSAWASANISACFQLQ